MPSPSLIRFPCRCGHRFEVPIDQAAETVQCPDCGLLCDIPTLADLENIGEDGTVRMRPAEIREDPHRLQDLTHYFGRETLDESGEERDLRATFEDLQKAGVEPIPFKDEQTFSQIAPKYDPETGELIEPIGVATPAPRDTLPGAGAPIPVARRALSYATGEQAVEMTLPRVLLEMCQPVNIVVMLFILVLHILVQATTFALLYGLFFFVVGKVVIWMFILSHYANTIDDIGPDNRDELPRPMRGISFGDDIWRPFVSFAGALVACFLPALLVWLNVRGEAKVQLAWTGLAVLLGSIPFPAVLLTLATSGAIDNLRPDRVGGVMRVSGVRYIIALITWLAVVAAYPLAFGGLWAQLINLGSPGGTPMPLIGHWGIVYPVLFAAIFLMHFFCWQLGLIYRHCQVQFPWVLQRHVSQRQRAEIERAKLYRGSRRLARDATTAQALNPRQR